MRRRALRCPIFKCNTYKSLGKGLEHFIDKSKAQKAAFGMYSIKEF